VRLIGDLTRLAQEPLVPENQRRGCLDLIGWLARRMAHEGPHTLGCHGQEGPRTARSEEVRATRDCDEPSPNTRRSTPP
jgi:hypothetical protein